MLTEYRVDGGAVDDLLGRPRTSRSSTAREASLGPVEAGAARPLRPDDRRLRRHHPGRRPGHALVPGEGLRGLPAQAAVPRGPDRRRLLQRRRLRALPEPGAVAARRRVREDRLGRERPRLGGDLLRPRDPALRRRRPARRARRARSTRSTTTTSTRSASRSRAASGRTTRSRSSASSYTIRRNGDVINEFENTPGKIVRPRRRSEHDAAAVRAGLHRPAEPRRRGHDAVPQRPRRGPLARRAQADDGAGPFTVTGAGPHTIEVRSIDAAGNVEAARRSTFEIGARDAGGLDDGTPTVPLAPTSSDPAADDRLAGVDRLGSVASRITRATFARRGVAVPISCTGAMDGSAKLTVSSRRASSSSSPRATLASEDAKCWGPHSIKVTLKPSSSLAGARRARAGRRA